MSETPDTPATDQHPIDSQVQTLLDGRLNSARHLADAFTELNEARARAADAERTYSEAYKDAQRAGWDTKELSTHLGFEDPSKTTRRRNTTRRTTSPKASPTKETSEPG